MNTLTLFMESSLVLFKDFLLIFFSYFYLPRPTRAANAIKNKKNYKQRIVFPEGAPAHGEFSF